jgi:hypothetical protein
LLLYCARTQIKDALALKIHNLLKKGIEWQVFLRLAQHHSVTSLVYWNLERLAPEFLPNSPREQLREHYYTNACRNLILTGELIKILNIFNTDGIKAIPFRGPTAAVSFYGDLSLREFGDLDILVRRDDALQAKNVLVGSGYKPLFPLPTNKKAILARGEYTFILGGNKVSIDLHWPAKKDPFHGRDPERIWRKLDQISLEGHSVSAVSPEEQALWLCTHGAKHNWRKLSWLCDLNQLISNEEGPDWERTVRKAYRLRIARMLRLGLFLVKELLGSELPPNLLKLLHRDQKTGLLAKRVVKNLFDDNKGQNAISENPMFFLEALESSTDRLRHLVDQLFVPTPWVWKSGLLPSTLFSLYYLIRPAQLMKRYGFRTLRNVRG